MDRWKRFLGSWRIRKCQRRRFFIYLLKLYTNGSTGKQKWIFHLTGGYLTYNTGEIFMCTADVGWITGHSWMFSKDSFRSWCLNRCCLWSIIEFYNNDNISTYPNVSCYWKTNQSKSMEMVLYNCWYMVAGLFFQF